ncbi:MAG: uroporphyrinogen-III C-methyltransferase [Deltaproteobacteria bacterium]|nr:uroporphyrinogen-III C-methyltransferase [Deltaproteobacteria bacterium]
MKNRGKVYIVGSGPGDPGLITVRGVQCIRRSDVIVYDYLMGQEILRYASADARLIYVGKKGGEHTMSQERINQILVDEAKAGNRVARIKGGDPFVFGRGGEEAQALHLNGIPFEIIPGVTSAIAVPSYAGIPLTHRNITSTAVFVTGHEDPTKKESDIDWEAIASIGTIVFLMGVKNLPTIVAKLVEKGRDPGTKVALIRWGTTPRQETLTGSLDTIVKLVEEQDFKPPAVFVVGDVAGLRGELSWFEKKPLFGKGIVITRPEAQSAEFADLLYEEGARVIPFPTIKIVPPESFDDLDGAIEHIGKYNWIVFTSVNGVGYFFDRLFYLGKDARNLAGVGICAIGPATSRAVERYGIRVDLVPDNYVSESVVTAFEKVGIAGKRILIPRAEIARDLIPESLAEMSALCDVLTVYRTISSRLTKEEFSKIAQTNTIDVITFTSPSTVNNFINIVGKDNIPPDTRIACIGPVTKIAAEEAGLTVHIVAESYTTEGVVHAMIDYFQKDAK